MTEWIRFKKLDPFAMAPLQATEGAAAVDLIATSVNNDNGLYCEIGSGLAFEIPKGYVGLLFPRSSVSKTGAWLANSVGVIDSDYRGEVRARYYEGHESFSVGERFAQLMIVPIPQVKYQLVDQLDETARGTGGFGSSGK